MWAPYIIVVFVATAYCLCNVRGKDYCENEKWVEGNFLMQCLKMGDWGGWRTTILGCMVDGEQICVGTNATIGGKTYICEDAGNGVVRMRYFWTETKVFRHISCCWFEAKCC